MGIGVYALDLLLVPRDAAPEGGVVDEEELLLAEVLQAGEQ